MCDPVSLLAVGVATSAAATGVSVYGQYKSGVAQQAAIDAQKDENQYNARILERQAEQIGSQIGDVAVAGKEALAQYGRKANQFKGTQRTSFAASGVIVDTGSAADVVYDTERMAGEDALTIRRNIAKEKEKYITEQQNLLDRAGRLKTSYYGTVDPYAGAGTSILTGVSDLTKQFLNVGTIQKWWGG